MSKAAPGWPGVVAATCVWFAAAVAAGAAGFLRAARPPLPQVLIAGLTAALLLAMWTAARDWARRVDVRALVLVHASRFVGLYFLVLYGRGELPYAFAVPGGVGDIAVAVLALAVAAWARPGTPGGRGAILAWNVFGLADIVMVVATASRLAMADPRSMQALLHLPLSLLPTFLVPIIIATHILLFARLRSH